MKITKQTGTANTTASPGRQILYLAVHYTAGVSCKEGSASGCASWFANPGAGGSADYIVDEGGLVQYNPDPKNRYCWAVGGSHFGTQGGRLYGVAKNANCVSLEICSGNKVGKITYPNDPNYYFTDKVLEMAKQAVQYLMQLYGIDAQHVIRHYDVNGKCCPGIIGWNKDSGSEAKWEEFHAAIGGTPIQYYRVRASWENEKSQIGAYTELKNAKEAADQYGYNVYDSTGKCVYEGVCTGTQARSIHSLGDEKAKAAAMLELVHKADHSGILPSVTTAQMILESGYCGTDLALNANNCFGMKENLSGNTWSNSTWDGKSIYKKQTQEDDGSGRYYWITANFRKYSKVEDSIGDHSAYLLGAMNGSKKRYAGLTNAKNYREAITIIKNGGYATDTRYISKICDIIQRYGLDRYDAEYAGGGSGEKQEEKKTESSWYRVRKSWEDEGSQLGAFGVLQNAKNLADQHAGYNVYDSNGELIYNGKQTGIIGSDTPFTVKVDANTAYIRKGPGTNYGKIRMIEAGIFTIVEVESGKGSNAGWGKLKSGAGWISLDKCTRIQ